MKMLFSTICYPMAECLKAGFLKDTKQIETYLPRSFYT